ncbi:putative F-box protein At3g51171 [Bidens hawaiensis]|uniref:putative F-box protein At3g51171 n=1 Tax=Bidens hawaiensis TaxID=980011 RepID=UPI00404A6BC5
MSDYLPIEILDKIMKLFPVKSLMQFRSVFKTWKSWIDSSDFVHTYTRQQHHLLVKYYDADEIPRFISIADDDTFPFKTISLNPPPRFSVNDREHFLVFGWSHGLLCYFSSTEVGGTTVIWNPCIRRAFRTVVPNLATLNTVIYSTVLGFGVCPVTNDPKIVKIVYVRPLSVNVNVTSIPFQVELFTLSTGAWRSLSGNLPHISVQFYQSFSHTNYSVAANGFIYWIATDTMRVDGVSRFLIVSFDLTREDFVEVHLPNKLARSIALTMYKVRESLVILQHGLEPSKKVVGLWIMEGGLFTQRYTFNLTDRCLSMYQDHMETEQMLLLILNKLNNLGLDGIGYSHLVYPYMETLFLHDRQNLTEVVQGHLLDTVLLAWTCMNVLMLFDGRAKVVILDVKEAYQDELRTWNEDIEDS